MTLRYGQSNRRSGKKVVSFLFAVIVLLLAIAATAAWMLIRYHQSTPPVPDDRSDLTSQYEDPLTDTNASLVIFHFSDSTRFVLIQTDPAHNVVNVAAVPHNLTDTAGDTLTTILNKHGSLRVIQTVSAALELSVDHYITWSADGTRSFLNDLNSGVTFTLPQEIRYTDESGVTTRLSAGEQKLTGAQAAAVLQYDDWNAATRTQDIAMQMVAAVLNQYLIPEQRLDGYFAALADTAHTDLRIDHFNGFRRVLTHLSDSNTQGSLCRTVTIIGTESNGRFIPNVPAMREQTGLYH